MLGLTGAQAGPWRQDADRVYNFVAAWRSAGAVAKLHSMKDHLEAVCRKFFWHGERLPRLLPAHPYLHLQVSTRRALAEFEAATLYVITK